MMDQINLKHCPFCGTKAKMLGGPYAQERYSIWCKNRHHLEGGMNAQELADTWNTRHEVPIDAENNNPAPASQ